MQKRTQVLLAAAELNEMPDNLSSDEREKWLLNTTHVRGLRIKDSLIAARLSQIAGVLLDEC